MTLSVFEFENKPVRFVGTAEAPEWIAQDVTDTLGIDRTQIRRLEDYQKGVHKVHTPGGMQEMITVKEAGLYALIFTSRKDAAKRFQRWVFEEVLPSIRKTGYYVSDAQRQQHSQARMSGKYSRRSLTDAIKGYISNHPELSDNARKWLYKNATDALYRQTHGKQAQSLVKLIGCEKSELRDRLSMDELVVISSIEDTAIRLIDSGVEPQEAILDAASRVMAIGLFSERYAALSPAE
jgi:prophage antirepressor-like protein